MIWPIVLAGGSGTRLAEQARLRYGYARPKQFCDFDGRGTLLARTIARARRFAPDRRIVAVTTRTHRAEALEALDACPEVVHVEQPIDRGTTVGLVLGLVHAMARDPGAHILVLPSDHAVTDETRFASAINEALVCVARDPDRMAILAAESDGGADDGYGWLVPVVDGGRWAAVERFREKPGPSERAELAARGARINTFVFAVQGATMARAVAERCPTIWSELARGRYELGRFEQLPASSFSRDVLERVPERLALIPVAAAAGWSDIGTPERLALSLRPHGEVEVHAATA